MVIKDIRFVMGAVDWTRLPADGLPEVAFIGRSNVGKSSLLNMMAGRRALARTSRTPGKTREFNCYLVNDRLRFVDIPGYGYARVSRSERNQWGRRIGAYLTERAPLRAVLHLIDSRHPPTSLDRDIFLLMREVEAPCLVVLTKADKISRNLRVRSQARAKSALEEFGIEAPLVLSSAKEGFGRGNLLSWIADLVA